MDDLLKERVVLLKAERANALAAYDRVVTSSGPDVPIDAGKVEAFGRSYTEKLESGDVHARKTVIRSVGSGTTVGKNQIRIMRDKIVLAAGVSGQKTRKRICSWIRK